MPPKWNESISYCKSVENWCYSDFHVFLLGSIFLLSANFSYFLVVFAVYTVRPHLIFLHWYTARLPSIDNYSNAGIGETGWFRFQYWYWIRIFDFEYWFWYWLRLGWSIGVGFGIDSNRNQVLILISSWFRFRSWFNWIPWQESNRV